MPADSVAENSNFSCTVPTFILHKITTTTKTTQDSNQQMSHITDWNIFLLLIVLFWTQLVGGGCLKTDWIVKQLGTASIDNID